MESTRRKPKNCRVTSVPHGGICSAVSCYIFYNGVHELGVDVREPFKICLVYVGNDQLIWRRQHRLSSCEELIEVFSPFAALQGKRKTEKGLNKGTNTLAELSGYMQGFPSFLRSSWEKIFFSDISTKKSQTNREVLTAESWWKAVRKVSSISMRWWDKEA